MGNVSLEVDHYTILLIDLLNNLTDDEMELLNAYVQQDAYADLKEMIDQRTNYIFEVENDEFRINANKYKLDESELLLGAPNLTKSQLHIIEAYQNATIYYMIWALWNWKVEEILPEIDQNAILEYYEEKRMEDLDRQSFFVRLWKIIKQWFRNDEDDQKHCYANDPSCIRTVIEGLRLDERKALERWIDQGNLSDVNIFIENKLCTAPTLYEEFHSWNANNDVPSALRDIIFSLTYAQQRAMDKLRKLELTNALKDYYRGRIEQRTTKEQQVAEVLKFNEFID
ncbi:unnamed protein product [Anisakis simplex]|uniref:DnaD domain protein n=1 Tax=Anisakis simplex TaxID=6269 RepID=A0A0M3JZ12_ANISI|nr:unnamed protein product [Anisakis simplex]